MTVIEVQGLSYVYPAGAHALVDVSFSLSAGERIALLGPNGAGKSTLLLHLNGILMCAGQVRVKGEPITKQSLPQVRRTVGLVFPSPDDQLFMPTVLEDVAFGPLNHGLAPDAAKTRSLTALAAVGMAGLEHRAPQQLSTGQKKRAALATVLVMDAEVLVFDEPVAGLDPRGRREFTALLADLACAQLIATHDLDLARQLTHRSIVLDEGRIVAEGPTGVVLSDEALLRRHGLA